MERICRRVLTTDLAVLESDDPASDARRVIRDEIRRAIDESSSGAIVLGCADIAVLTRSLSDDLGVPVIDGLAAAVKMGEARVGSG